MDSRFDCRDLLQRSVIHYEAERKASSTIISAPIQGVTTGTVCCECTRGPSEDRSSVLVSFPIRPGLLYWPPQVWIAPNLQEIFSCGSLLACTHVLHLS